MLGIMVDALMLYFHWCLILGIGVVMILLIITFMLCARRDDARYRSEADKIE